MIDYFHPFDNYRGQDVIVFDEFRSGINFSLFLQLIDAYPVELPCRYNNKYTSDGITYENIEISKDGFYKIVDNDNPFEQCYN